MGQVRAEIVAVGTELLLGQISNTNAQWISEQLAKYGIHTLYHSVVGDNLERVSNTFEHAGKRSELVFVTGGLGPTDDDLTREAFQIITGFHLIEEPASMHKIEGYFKRANRQMTLNNRKQARIFEGAYVLSNEVGMAPGMIIDYDDTTWVFMPGVPREMKHMLSTVALPHLKNKLHLNAVIQSRMLRFIGIGESQLEHDLKKLIVNQDNPTIAPLASEGEVAIRITAKAATKEIADDMLNQTEQEILAISGSYFYGYDEETIEQKVVSLLKESTRKIAAAESLTGGKFMDKMVAVSGASSVCQGGIVCYATSVKQKVLGVSDQTIKTHGTVSKQCATEMAENVMKKLDASIGVSFTGVAGPDESEGKKVGTVYIAISQKGSPTVVKEYTFSGDRETIRNRTVKKGYELLWQQIKKNYESAR
ncbi:competence/damage-inducible protein A [Aquibacillus sp. 3ASR75-11]|uniref:Putative competence-damage inducible protein n=1 Tax=Terrihalobacillus insolitus TaxID=2950438 RepID=A0A9X3WTD4_9BACI|nr:competence/damage-inducible protein A [Terrihalobacillus insolitus]MDC3414070.1 competence/damage-inducible protein A [Terrihalobacillus insolitus]MDC3423511.1 competence/damage-inducible protein A [Terrihalobacillus insolitus]